MNLCYKSKRRRKELQPTYICSIFLIYLYSSFTSGLYFFHKHSSYCVVSFYFSLKESLYYFFQGKSSQSLFIWECLHIAFIFEGQFCCIQHSLLTVFFFQHLEYISHYLLTSTLFFFLAALGLYCCVQATLCCGAWASHCGGFSCCSTWALGHTGFSSCGMQAQQLWLAGSRAQAQQLWHTGLVAPQHVGSSWTRD